MWQWLLYSDYLSSIPLWLRCSSCTNRDVLLKLWKYIIGAVFCPYIVACHHRTRQALTRYGQMLVWNSWLPWPLILGDDDDWSTRTIRMFPKLVPQRVNAILVPLPNNADSFKLITPTHTEAETVYIYVEDITDHTSSSTSEALATTTMMTSHHQATSITIVLVVMMGASDGYNTKVSATLLNLRSYVIVGGACMTILVQ